MVLSSGRSIAASSLLALLISGCGSASDNMQGAPPSPPVRQCGVEVVKRGEGYAARARECIWQAYKKREPAEFTTTRYTIEGDPVTYHVEVTLTGVVVVVDSKDRYGQQGIHRHTCRAFEKIMQEGSKDRFGFALSGCTGGGMERLAVP